MMTNAPVASNMKRNAVGMLLTGIGLSILVCYGPSLNAQSKKQLGVITPELMLQHIGYLASDSLKGRNTPSPGLEMAAEYIAGQFKKEGIPGFKGSYFQPLPLQRVNLGADNELAVTRNGATETFRIKSDYVPFENTADKGAEGSLVFAGYGITAPEYDYDDYAGLDVKDKIVVVMRHEPGEEDSSSVFKGREPTRYSFIEEKTKIAAEHGAAGLIVVTDPLNHVILRPTGFPWPALSKIIPKEASPLVMAGESGATMPVVHAGEKVIEKLFGSVDSLRNMQTRIDRGLKPESFAFDDTKVRLKTSLDTEPLPTANVVGFIEGSDPVLKDEVLVIGAHYDHVGTMTGGKEGEDVIFNGADDNASGTAGVMAIAKAFAEANKKPRRSVLFILFTGEEKGLFGSRYYVKQPLMPLEKTVAMINLDMIGRAKGDTVQAIGAGRSKALLEALNEANKQIKLQLTNQEEMDFGGSDHAPFLGKNIPVVFFFTGIHEDYHQVSDEVEKIRADKAAQVARLAFILAWKIAGDDRYYPCDDTPAK
jgi:hypothetical protein